MKLLWTSKALSDLARLHEFLAPANQAAAARAVQALSRAPAGLSGAARATGFNVLDVNIDVDERG